MPTSIACLTPPGAGAIATLAVQGPDAWAITRSLFRARLPEKPIAGKFYLGRLGEDDGACDEVVLAIRPDGLELHCHGGVEVVRYLEELFTARGVRLCFWKGLPAMANLSRLRLLAYEPLQHAPTVKTAALLLDQVHGAFEKALADILDLLQKSDHSGAAHLITRLVQTQHLGRHLVQPFRVVVAGAPNVGKSSLVNALAGFTRSLVADMPGTTRDVVTTRIALDGWPVELTDTAGLHESSQALERAGMARAKAALDQADLSLWILDASAPLLLPPPGINVDGMVINKMDLPAVWEWGKPSALPPLSAASKASPCHSISCKTGQGLTELCQWVASLLRVDLETAPNEGIAFRPELCDQVLLANEAAQAEDWPRVGAIVGGI